MFKTIHLNTNIILRCYTYCISLNLLVYLYVSNKETVNNVKIILMLFRRIYSHILRWMLLTFDKNNEQLNWILKWGLQYSFYIKTSWRHAVFKEIILTFKVSQIHTCFVFSNGALIEKNACMEYSLEVRYSYSLKSLINKSLKDIFQKSTFKETELA